LNKINNFKRSTYLDVLNHIFDDNGWFDFVLVLFYTLHHLETLKDVDDVIDPTAPDSQLRNAVIDVHQIPLKLK
jgi:hypothetical protein